MPEELQSRFILMRNTGQGQAYLYGHSTSVQSIGDVDVVEVRTFNPDYHARYQLDRLASGWQAVGNDIYTTQDEAATAAREYVTLGV